MIVGVVVGILAVICIIAIVVVVLLVIRRRRNQRDKSISVVLPDVEVVPPRAQSSNKSNKDQYAAVYLVRDPSATNQSIQTTLFPLVELAKFRDGSLLAKFVSVSTGIFTF